MGTDFEAWIRAQGQTLQGRVTIGASAVAVALAAADMWKDGFDGSLAVLTLTLIVVIWYTRFTHELAENAEKSLTISRALFAREERRLWAPLMRPLADVRMYLQVLPLKKDGENLPALQALRVEVPKFEWTRMLEIAPDVGEWAKFLRLYHSVEEIEKQVIAAGRGRGLTEIKWIENVESARKDNSELIAKGMKILTESHID